MTNLTEEQKREIYEEMKKAEEEKENKKKQEREEYKNLVDELVMTNFKKLEDLSELLSKTKKETFNNFSTVLQMKSELYGVREGQQSHTFTSKDGKSITIGHRITDAFDDTVHAGIEKVKVYIGSLAAGDKKKEIEGILNLLLKKDKNGNLKASRVLELKKIAEQVGDPEFIDGVKIIEAAYRPNKSSTFIECFYKDKNGKRINIPLSMTSIEDKAE